MNHSDVTPRTFLFCNGGAYFVSGPKNRACPVHVGERVLVPGALRDRTHEVTVVSVAPSESILADEYRFVGSDLWVVEVAP